MHGRKYQRIIQGGKNVSETDRKVNFINQIEFRHDRASLIQEGGDRIRTVITQGYCRFLTSGANNRKKNVYYDLLTIILILDSQFDRAKTPKH